MTVWANGPGLARRWRSARCSRRARCWRGLALITWDGVAWLVGLVAATMLRFDGDLAAVQWKPVFETFVLAVVLQAAVGHVAHRYLGRHLLGAIDDVIHVSAVTGLVGMVLFVLGS